MSAGTLLFISTISLIPLICFSQDTSLLGMYAGALLAATATISFRFMRSPAAIRIIVARHPRDTAMFCGLLAVSAALRFHRLGHFSVWLDEADQVIRAVDSGASVVLRAAGQQQPPLDYLLTQTDVGMFGVSELGSRFHSALLGSMTPPLFFLFLRELGLPLPVSAFGALCLTADPILVYYSREGRPYSLAVFIEIAYLSAICRFWRRENPAPDDSWILGCATLIFFLSIGFQPLVLVAAFSLWAGAALYKPDLWPRVRLFLLISAVALAAYVPILLALVKNSSVFLHQHWSSNALDFVQDFRPALLGRYFDAYPHPMLVLFALSAAASIAFSWRREAAPEPRWGAIAGAFGLSLAAAALIHASAYAVFINWPYFNQRYFITFLPIFYLAGCLLVANTLARLRPPATIAAGVLGLALIPSVMASTAIALGISPPSALVQTLYEPSDSVGLYLMGKYTSDFRSIFAHLAEHGRPGDIALPLTFRARGELTLDGFMSSDFYVRSRDFPVRTASPWFNVPEFLVKELARKDPPKTAYFVNAPEFNSYSLLDSDLAALRLGFPDAEFVKFDGCFSKEAVMIKLPLGSNPRRRIREFYEHLARLHAGKPWLYTVENRIRALTERR